MFVAVASDASTASTLAAAVRSKTGDEWRQAGAASVGAWLAKGVQPTLSGKAKDLYVRLGGVCFFLSSCVRQVCDLAGTHCLDSPPGTRIPSFC